MKPGFEPSPPLEARLRKHELLLLISQALSIPYMHFPFPALAEAGQVSRGRGLWLWPHSHRPAGSRGVQSPFLPLVPSGVSPEDRQDTGQRSRGAISPLPAGSAQGLEGALQDQSGGHACRVAKARGHGPRGPLGCPRLAGAPVSPTPTLKGSCQGQELSLLLVTHGLPAQGTITPRPPATLASGSGLGRERPQPAAPESCP